MRMNTSIPLQGQQPNILRTLHEGNVAAAHVNDMDRQNALNDIYQQHGAGISRGDSSALNVLAAHDPTLAQTAQSNVLGMDSTRMNMQHAAANQARLGRAEQRAIEEHAANMTAAEAAQARADIESDLAVLMTATDDASWDALAQQTGNPDMVGQFANRETAIAPYIGLKEVLDRQTPTPPQSSLGKFYADQRDGHIPEGVDAPQSGTNLTVNNNSGRLSPYQEAIDKKFADRSVEWQSGGGADAVKNLAQIGQVIERMEAGENLTGLDVKLQPDLLLALTNPNALDSRENVEEVVQRNLRLILGPQFTNDEGKRLIARAYNPALGEQENSIRLRRLFSQMSIAAEQTQAMVNYANSNGTLRGYEGRVPTAADFYEAIGESPEANESQSQELQISDDDISLINKWLNP